MENNGSMVVRQDKQPNRLIIICFLVSDISFCASKMSELFLGSEEMHDLLLYLPTQMRFLIGVECVTYCGLKLTNSEKSEP